jgi:hypothetical protein
MVYLDTVTKKKKEKFMRLKEDEKIAMFHVKQ